MHVGGVGGGEELTCIDTQFEPSGMHLGRGGGGGKEEGRGGEGRRRGGEGRRGEGRGGEDEEEKRGGVEEREGKEWRGKGGGDPLRRRGVCVLRSQQEPLSHWGTSLGLVAVYPQHLSP